MDYQYHRLKAQLSVLKDVEKDHPDSTLADAISKIELQILDIEQQL